MIWGALFAAANGWAVLMWLILIALPRGPFLQSLVFYTGVGLLCLAYVVLMGLLLGGAVDPASSADLGAASFFSIAGVRALFASDGGVTIGWIHYLALDLFAGLWIAKDADQKRFSRLVQVPVLLLTFIAGPAGLLVWFLIRERRARALAGPRKRLKL